MSNRIIEKITDIRKFNKNLEEREELSENEKILIANCDSLIEEVVILLKSITGEIRSLGEPKE